MYHILSEKAREKVKKIFFQGIDIKPAADYNKISKLNLPDLELRNYVLTLGASWTFLMRMVWFLRIFNAIRLDFVYFYQKVLDKDVIWVYNVVNDIYIRCVDPFR